MTKFKVGDKVIFNNEYASAAKELGYKINKVYEVQDVSKNHKTLRITNEDGITHFFNDERFELAEPKITKNQRITALENEVAELKLIVHELRGKKSIEPSTTNHVEDIIEFDGQQYRKVVREVYEGDVIVFYGSRHTQITDGKPYKVFKGKHIEENKLSHTADSGNEYPVDGEFVDGYCVYELIKGGPNPQILIVDETIKTLTPNRQRAAIIEKAKKFVEDLKDEEGKYSKTTPLGYRYLDFEFVVNRGKRTVVALGRLFYYPPTHKVYEKGIAKCNPSDVFNEHIGKAIALGRALGLDVSEFEQAVQPNEVVAGHVTKGKNTGRIYNITEVRSHEEIIAKEHLEEQHTSTRYVIIIDDTNAIY